jgi:hypothetical protein
MFKGPLLPWKIASSVIDPASVAPGFLKACPSHPLAPHPPSSNTAPQPTPTPDPLLGRAHRRRARAAHRGGARQRRRHPLRRLEPPRRQPARHRWGRRACAHARPVGAASLPPRGAGARAGVPRVPRPLSARLVVAWHACSQPPQLARSGDALPHTRGRGRAPLRLGMPEAGRRGRPRGRGRPQAGPDSSPAPTAARPFTAPSPLQAPPTGPCAFGIAGSSAPRPPTRAPRRSRFSSSTLKQSCASSGTTRTRWGARPASPVCGADWLCGRRPWAARLLGGGLLRPRHGRARRVPSSRLPPERRRQQLQPAWASRPAPCTLTQPAPPAPPPAPAPPPPPPPPPQSVLASGGDDHLVLIWDLSRSSARCARRRARPAPGRRRTGGCTAPALSARRARFVVAGTFSFWARAKPIEAPQTAAGPSCPPPAAAVEGRRGRPPCVSHPHAMPCPSSTCAPTP